MRKNEIHRRVYEKSRRSLGKRRTEILTRNLALKENKVNWNSLILELLNFLWISLLYMLFELLSYHINKKFCIVLLKMELIRTTKSATLFFSTWEKCQRKGIIFRINVRFWLLLYIFKTKNEFLVEASIVWHRWYTKKTSSKDLL